MPKSAHPDLLVGFETGDDAGVFRLSADQALVQTMDFFTPIVDDPYAYGVIAAANALSDIYAMGGSPLTAMNIACFDPSQAPAEVWASVLKGMFDKCAEAGCAVVGGHSVEDKQPKFGLSVTGVVNPQRMLDNAHAKPGDSIYLSKPLGTGIITTAHKFDDCPDDALGAAIQAMSTLNRSACEAALEAAAQCATDITGFGLAGHLFNVACASGVAIEVDSSALPLLPRLRELVERKNLTGGSQKNLAFLRDSLSFDPSVPEWLREVVLDPQTSGGLAIFAQTPVRDYPAIGHVVEGPAAIRVI